MKRFAFAIPGDLSLATGGYAYDRRVIAECRAAGWSVDHIALADDFPNPAGESLAEAEDAFGAVPADMPILVDGLAFGVLPADLLRRAGKRFIALVHHPLALETGLSSAGQERLRMSEREALSVAEAVIVTSPATARVLAAEYGVGADRIAVALPGVDVAARAKGGNVPPLILAVGALVPRKGYPVLVEALTRLKHLAWLCRIVGASDRDSVETARIVAAISAHDLSDRVVIAGQLPDADLSLAYDEADLFALPSFHEGYGMVLSEALARGLPIVSTDAGAIPETVADGAGLLVPPGDAPALAAAIARVIDQPEMRRAMSEAAWIAGQKLPRWRDTAQQITAAITRLS